MSGGLDVMAMVSMDDEVSSLHTCVSRRVKGAIQLAVSVSFFQCVSTSIYNNALLSNSMSSPLGTNFSQFGDDSNLPSIWIANAE